MTEDTHRRIRCRTIRASDAPGIAKLLARGFPNRPAHYWLHAFETLAKREAPEDLPRFGYLLEDDTTPVGAILMIFRKVDERDVRCNISSWYVDEAFRGYASLLIAAALRRKDVTYINISPARHTWPVIEAQGFKRYCHGQMLTLPILTAAGGYTVVESFDVQAHAGVLTEAESEMMLDHTSRGCLGFVARDGAAASPFLFLPRRIFRQQLPVLQLVYCRDVSDYVRCAGALGRALLACGRLVVLVDAVERIRGLHGIYFKDRGPKYARGPCPPRLGDLAYCESVLFG
ncbi:MAG: acyl-CoA acyltransferase [Methylocystis sp.]|uniref:acyl-CoA acyltransferase n=1 Tax=Methylocystis sp. TaxID=1911079 RepID=UPI003DA435DB